MIQKIPSRRSILEKRKKKNIFLGLALICFISALFLGFMNYLTAQKQTCVFPNDLKIGQIPVGGLTPTTAQAKINQIYKSPITLLVGDSTIAFFPEDFIDQNNLDLVMEKVSQPCAQFTPWNKFWKSIWNKQVEGFESENLDIEIDEESLHQYINNQIINRYTEAALPALALPGTTQFTTGKSGTTIDVDALLASLKEEIQIPEGKVIEIPFIAINNDAPDISQIDYLLNDQIRNANFDGIVEVYLKNLNSGDILQFATQNGNTVPADIAFTAASTMKIPIMVSSLKREGWPIDDLVSGWLERMIIYSENDPADRLMERVNPVRGPLVVTDDLQELGLQNSFISGYFYLGAPLLEMVSTPSNSRTDINLNPDLYNQTTTSDIGNLLSEIYDCALNGNGKLVQNSAHALDAEKCNLMIEILSQNQIGALIEAGLPESTQIAHKHGWSEESDGLLHTVSDVAIIFGPESDFVLSIFVYSPNQLLFDDANYLIAKLAQTAFNGLNPNHQLTWLFSEN